MHKQGPRKKKAAKKAGKKKAGAAKKGARVVINAEAALKAGKQLPLGAVVSRPKSDVSRVLLSKLLPRDLKLEAVEDGRLHVREKTKADRLVEAAAEASFAAREAKHHLKRCEADLVRKAKAVNDKPTDENMRAFDMAEARLTAARENAVNKAAEAVVIKKLGRKRYIELMREEEAERLREDARKIVEDLY